MRTTTYIRNPSSLPTVADLGRAARAAELGLHPPIDPLRGPPNVILITPDTLRRESQQQRKAGGFLWNFTTAFSFNRWRCKFPDYHPIHKQQSSPTRRKSNKSLLRYWPIVLCVLSIAIWTLIIFRNAWLNMYGDLATNRTERKGAKWHEDASFYEIFPASFLDTDGDGYGDFEGITRRLEYIRDLGMTAVRLNSVFSALDYPLEYEHLIDLRAADPHLGRAGDLRRLLRAAHRLGLRVLLDLNPAVTSDQHTWALHWQRGIPGYEHFYASANRSKDPPEMENSEGPPPEDWELTQRTFGGHYLLNWSNPFVQEEYKRALEYWIDEGIDGIYMKHVETLHVLHPRDLIDIFGQWRSTLDTPPSEWAPHGLPSRRVLIVSSKFATYLEGVLGKPSAWGDVLKHVDLLDCPLLVGNGEEMAEQVAGLRRVSGWPERGPVPMWHLGSSDTFRLASRIDPRYHMAAFYLLMTLPGASSVFYGDEIGLKDSFDVTTGRVYRGGQLTPMQWTSDTNTSGGFTDNTTAPWLPLTPDHATTNVQSQQSRLKSLARLVTFRKSTLGRHFRSRGHKVEVLDPNVIVLERTHARDKSRRVLLAANFGSVSEEKQFPEAYGSVRAVLTTAEPTKTRVRSRGFTMSPGAAFLAEVTLAYYPSSEGE